MNRADFENLSVEDQALVIKSHGVFIAERRCGIDRVYLYAINYFYVELLHSLSCFGNRGISIYKVFEDVRLLEIYLESSKTERLITGSDGTKGYEYNVERMRFDN